MARVNPGNQFTRLQQREREKERPCVSVYICMNGCVYTWLRVRSCSLVLLSVVCIQFTPRAFAKPLSFLLLVTGAP